MTRSRHRTVSGQTRCQAESAHRMFPARLPLYLSLSLSLSLSLHPRPFKKHTHTSEKWLFLLREEEPDWAHGYNRLCDTKLNHLLRLQLNRPFIMSMQRNSWLDRLRVWRSLSGSNCHSIWYISLLLFIFLQIVRSFLRSTRALGHLADSNTHCATLDARLNDHTVWMIFCFYILLVHTYWYLYTKTANWPSGPQKSTGSLSRI